MEFVGKIIDIDGKRWRCCGKMGKTAAGNDGFLMQELTSKELSVVPEWIIAHGKNLNH